MKTSRSPFARFLSVAGVVSLAFVSPVYAATYYVTPSGAGSQNGGSWSNAYPQSQIQSALNALQPGDVLRLGSGTYTLSSLEISGSGTSSNPIILEGIDTGGGLPLFQGTFNVNNSASSGFLRFPADAHHWVIRNLAFKNQPHGLDMPLNGTTFTLRTNLTFEGLQFDSVEDAMRIRNASDILVKNCTAIRYTKRGFRVGRYSRYLTFEGCSADCNGGDDSFPAKGIPFGFACDATSELPIIHDILFVDCIARNNRFSQSSGSFWNGDGFTSERGAYNIVFRRCKSYDNHDAGFDNKSTDLTYEDCVAAGNSRGFRHWGPGGQMTNCVAAFNAKWGGSGSSYGLWISGNNGGLEVDYTTFHGDGTLLVIENGGSLTVRDSILSTTSGSAAFASGSVTLTRTASYRPGSGTDPDFVNPFSGWRGIPADAMDSQTYGLTKGYASARAGGGDTEAPSVPTGLAASSISSTSFALSWSASTDNVAVTGYEVFRDGVSIATPSGTSVGVTGLSPSTTYQLRVRARDAAGNWSAQSTALSVTTVASGGAVRIEAGTTSPYTDTGGNVWAADYGFSGGGAVDRGSIAIAGTNDDRLYQTERWGLSGYAIPIANGTYTVNLHFAETFSGVTAAGQRVFSVTAEGASPSGWSNIDVFAEAGGRNIALIKSASVSVSDGTLNLGFSASVDNPMISAIEVVGQGGDTQAPTVPAGLGASDLTGTSFTLSWNPSSDNVGVTAYEVRLDGQLYGTTAATSLGVTGLSAGTNYSVTVRAGDAAGNWSATSAPLNVTTPSSQGRSIGVNVSDPANSLGSSDIVGAVPAANWNNSTANNETLSDVVDSDGAATTADFSFNSTPYAYNNNTPVLAAPLTDDARMMRSQRAKSNASSMSVTVTAIPYAAYDVYVYWGGRVSSESVPATMTVELQVWNGSAWATTETKYLRDDDHEWDGTYDESTATSAAAAEDGREFAVFRNLSDVTFRVVATCGVRTGISGLQVVER